jgi:hypothetical protein
MPRVKVRVAVRIRPLLPKEIQEEEAEGRGKAERMIGNVDESSLRITNLRQPGSTLKFR